MIRHTASVQATNPVEAQKKTSELMLREMTPRALNNKIAEPVERKKIKDME